jgi:hypothetical protein
MNRKLELQGFEGRGGQRLPRVLVGQLFRLGIDVRVASGTPGHRRHERALWSRPECAILDTLHEARRRYLAGVRTHHPDRGGDAGRLHETVWLWSRIRRSFARRGYELC